MALELLSLPLADFAGDFGAKGLSPASGCLMVGLLPEAPSSSSSAAKSAASGICKELITLEMNFIWLGFCKQNREQFFL
jgi:hypothetical protein